MLTLQRHTSFFKSTKPNALTKISTKKNSNSYGTLKCIYIISTKTNTQKRMYIYLKRVCMRALPKLLTWVNRFFSIILNKMNIANKLELIWFDLIWCERRLKRWSNHVVAEMHETHAHSVHMCLRLSIYKCGCIDNNLLIHRSRFSNSR